LRDAGKKGRLKPLVGGTKQAVKLQKKTPEIIKGGEIWGTVTGTASGLWVKRREGGDSLNQPGPGS